MCPYDPAKGFALGQQWVHLTRNDLEQRSHPTAHPWSKCSLHLSLGLACKLRIICTCLNDRRKKKSRGEDYFMTHENYMEFTFQCPQIKFYRNTDIPICSHIVYIIVAFAQNHRAERQRPHCPQRLKYLLSDPLFEKKRCYPMG